MDSSISRRPWIWAVAALLVVVTSAATAWLTSRARAQPVAAASATDAGSDLSRIVQRRTIRAGYVSNPPSCIINPNTRRVTGIVAEAAEAMAQSAGLRAGRYDFVPCAIWPTAARAREADFSDPMFYSVVGAYARPDDRRFRAGPASINSPQVRIATIDGELAETIARTQFPRAQTVGLPQLTEITTMVLNVAQNKADVAFVERLLRLPGEHVGDHGPDPDA